MTTTPRTDGQIIHNAKKHSGCVVCADFARELERENTELRAVIESNQLDHGRVVVERDKLERENTELLAKLAASDEAHAHLLANHDTRLEREWTDLRTRLEIAEREVAALRSALNRIACWHEGEEVDGSFDEPGSAAVARIALRSVGASAPAPSIKAGPYTLTHYETGKFWLDNGEGEGMETSELKVENLLGEFFKREF